MDDQQKPRRFTLSPNTAFTLRDLDNAQPCGSAWKRDPGSGVIGVEKGPLIPVV